MSRLKWPECDAFLVPIWGAAWAAICGSDYVRPGARAPRNHRCRECASDATKSFAPSP